MSPSATNTSSEPRPTHGKPAEDDEEDYMTMAVAEPQSSTQVETSHQRRLRRQREAEARARPKPKAELAAEAERARESALATSIADNSKGAKMMAKLGYKPGSTLGAPGNVHARSEPIGIEMKDGREGIGALSEKKRKFREEAEKREVSKKKMKEDEGDFRERVILEREEKRLEGQWWGAMKVLEGLDDEAGKESNGSAQMNPRNGTTRTRDVNFFYRPIVLDRRGKRKEARRRHDMLQSLTRNATYDDPEEDAHDRQALGKEVESEDDEDDLDEELQEYLQLCVSERLEKILGELRQKWLYCFWCKYRYDTKEDLDSECPGEGEDEHG